MAGYCWCGEIYGNCEHYGQEETKVVWTRPTNKVEELEKVLKRIQATCGHPDPAEACRIILKLTEEALK